jgi:hypothetical protein
MADWNLHYPQWMIGDGQPDRSVGDVFKWFAVEFWSENALTKTSERTRFAIPAQDYRYRVVAEVVFVAEKAVLIDFGLVAEGNPNALQEARLGDFVTGEISIGFPLAIEITPDEALYKLGHQWRVNGISADLTPYVAAKENPRYHFRDITRISYREANSTSTTPAMDYILHCSDLGSTEVGWEDPLK